MDHRQPSSRTPPGRRYQLTPSATIPGIAFADDAQAVFAAVIEAGHLSINPAAEPYAGDWMYMHHHNGKAAFKHRTTRKYRFLAV